MSDDLIAFYRARLDEDEQVARHASDGPWGDHVGYISGGPTGATRVAQQAQSWNSDHIVRHDPVRVLREVEAGRRLIKRYENARASRSVWNRDVDRGYREACLDAIGDAAELYDNHEDYREEWRPVTL